MKKCFIIIAVSLLLMVLTAQNVDAYAGNDYVIDWSMGQRRIPIPKTYQVVDVIGFLGDEAGFMKNPDDLFIDKEGFLFVADTGNARILKLTREGSVVDIFEGSGEMRLRSPRGIYVDDDQAMYIADPANEAIIHLSATGSYVESFVQPESALLGDVFTFTPTKVYINATGYIYIIRGQHFMTMDAHNRFRGFVGANEIGFSMNELLVRIFASDEQKQRLRRRQASTYSNFIIHDDGMIYAVALSHTNQIKKINSVGKNIFKEAFYGEMSIDEMGRLVMPHFVDIAVDSNGIISALEENTGNIYQYDQEGNLLTVFGGLGERKGTFLLPSSIAVDEDGTIYILDKNRNHIQIFEPTNFIRLIHDAVKLYGEGKYDEALIVWREVLSIDANYSLAHKGIARALFKEGRFGEAMEEYKMAGDQEGYSEAFNEYRHQRFRKHFGLTLLIITGLIMLIYKLLLWLKGTAQKLVDRHITWQGGIE